MTGVSLKRTVHQVSKIRGKKVNEILCFVNNGTEENRTTQSFVGQNALNDPCSF